MAAMDTMRTTHTIPLDLQLSDHPSVRFLRAEVNAGEVTSFALVRYAVRGIERSKALRLDLDKRTFIDPGELEDGDDFREIARRIAPTIAERVAGEMKAWFSSRRV